MGLCRDDTRYCWWRDGDLLLNVLGAFALEEEEQLIVRPLVTVGEVVAAV